MTRNMRLGSGLCRSIGIAMARRPLKYRPVIESGWAATSAAVPCATIRRHAGARAQINDMVGLANGLPRRA